MKLAFVYAGQGSQCAGMGKDLYEANETFRKVMDEVDPTGEIKDICFHGTLEQLSDTRNTQPCMVAFACALTEVLKENGLEPSLVAGLSLGEYSALYTAKAFDCKTGVELAKFRGNAMADAVKGMQSKMCAVLQLDRTVLLKICEEASSLGIVEISNYNCPGQIVIGGEVQAVDKACELAMEQGARRCVPLNVSGPFHTSLMQPAGEKLFHKFKETEFHSLQIPVVFNATAKPLGEDETIPNLLVKQVQSSVMFEDSIKYMQSQGIDTIIEIGPGKVLSGFIRKTAREIKTYPVDSVETLNKVLTELKAQ